MSYLFYMRLKFAGAVLFLLNYTALFAQGNPENGSSYDDLLSVIALHEGTPKVWPYLHQYLAKAKREQNWPEAVLAYKEMLHESRGKLRFIYADSMVDAAKKSDDNDLIASSYLTKGVAFYRARKHQLALDNYLIANQYLIRSDDSYLRHKVKYSIAQIKYYLGYYNEAISLFRECVSFFKDSETIPYLKSLHHLSLCYTFTANYQEAASTAELALRESARMGEKSMLPYLDVALGVNYCLTGKYQQGVDNITYALPLIQKDRDFANEATANYYLGRAYWELGHQQKAVGHFMAVDHIFDTKHYIRPDLRRSYEYLIRYYNRKDAKDIELQYVEKLLKADSVLGKEFRYLIKKVHKEYDTAELLAEKEKLQADLSKSSMHGWIFKGLLTVAFVVVIILIRRHLKLRKLYRERFEELLKKDPNDKAEQVHPINGELDINPAIVKQILTKLEDFEHKKGFLKKNLTAVKLAESFDTNYKYLSKVIRHYKQTSFINYINDLRIDYLVERLKAETLLRKYTNGALASEAGFSTAQHFVNAFKKRAGMPPGYFVDEFEKIKGI
jgi:AraC-like DNA-binding protein